MIKTTFMRTASITFLSAIMLCTWNSKEAKAEEVNTSMAGSEGVTISDNSMAGMSQMLNDYYDEILSETGISVNNVSTAIFVDGEKLEAKDNNALLFNNKGLANVTDYVNIRKEATVDSEIVGRLFKAGAVTIEGAEGDWIKITSNKVSGYIKSEYLATGDDAYRMAEKSYTKYAEVTCNNLNIRSEASETSKSIGSASKGDKLEVVKILDEWVQIKTSSISKGFVSKNYVDFTYKFKYAKTMDEVKTDINCMVWPLPSDHRIYTYYGRRKAPTRGASTYHRGLDIGGAKGSKVVSVLAGKVIAAGYSSSAGNYVEVSHGNGVVTRYLHNSKLLVKVGQHVDQGEVISLVGSTGISTSPHLHFSLIVNGNNIDPYPYLKRVH